MVLSCIWLKVGRKLHSHACVSFHSDIECIAEGLASARWYQHSNKRQLKMPKCDTSAYMYNTSSMVKRRPTGISTKEQTRNSDNDWDSSHWIPAKQQLITTLEMKTMNHIMLPVAACLASSVQVVLLQMVLSQMVYCRWFQRRWFIAGGLGQPARHYKVYCQSICIILHHHHLVFKTSISSTLS